MDMIFFLEGDVLFLCINKFLPQCKITAIMNEFLDQLNFNFSETFSFPNYLLNIAICALLLYVLSLVYIKFGRSLSNRSQLSRVLILVGVTTFIIISIVKSSLALSLGLVGALSIIRFRTAIKEPEELGYFFIAIAIGLGLGADQIFPTLIGAIVLFGIIILSNSKKNASSINQNLIVNLKGLHKEDALAMQSKITDIVSSNANRTELIRLNKDKDSLNLNFLVVLSGYDSINRITDGLTQLDNEASITFIDSNNMII